MKNLICAMIVATASVVAYAAGLPTGYTEVEYIKANGSNTRIVTDYTPNPATDRIEAVVLFPTLDQAMCIWCSRGDEATKSSWTVFAVNSNGYKLRCDYSTRNPFDKYSSGLSTDTKYTISSERGSFTLATASATNTVGYAFEENFTAAGSPLALFASHTYNGSVSAGGYWGKQRLYSFKVWRNDEIIHYFVPCKDSGGNPTLVDVCDNPATLTRSGTFTAGDEGHFYDDSLVCDFTVAAIDLVVVTGSAICPEPVVKTLDGTLLTAGVDYDVSYENNVAAGIGLVIISGRGTYAGMTAYMSFTIANLYRAKPVVDEEGDGMSWANAMSFTNALAAVSASSGPSEIWLKEGTLTAEACSVTCAAPLVIRGGFAGTESTPDERAEGTMTILDGERTAGNLLTIENPEGADVTIDRIKFCRAKARGLVKTGTGGLRIYNCVFEANGLDTNKIYGRGMNVNGGGMGALVVSNCVYAGNRNYGQDGPYGGLGIYAKAFRSAVIDKSLFVTNGYEMSAPAASSPGGGYGWCGNKTCGAAIHMIGTPLTLRNSRFFGNCCAVRYNPINGSGTGDGSGGVVFLEGACGGSVIDHCVFIGNSDRHSYQGNDVEYSGALGIYLSSSSDKVTVNSCTFAYNITQGSHSGAGITVGKGDVDITNTILWENRRTYKTVSGYGSDVQVHSAGSANITHSLVTTLDGTGLAGAGLTYDPQTVFAADPQLVTTTADFTNLLVISSSQQYYQSNLHSTLVAMDAHLKSPGGYFLNDGSVGPATDDYSPAIDRGDPLADYANEPSPNGGRLNLGVFGNTAEASKTSIGQPEASVEVLFPNGVSRPVIRVTMGIASGTGYNATVNVTCSTGGVNIAEHRFEGVVKNDVLELPSAYYVLPGQEVMVTVGITADGAENVMYHQEALATGTLPAFVGKGGGPNVIHVRNGADGKQDGSSWTDAYPDLRTAFATVPDETKTEVWLSVTNDYMDTARTLAHSLTIRGGFLGIENSIEERPEGLRAKLSSSDLYKTMEFSVPAGELLTVERIHFTHSSASELKKTGSGNLLVRDCRFMDSKTSGTIDGRGIYASGGTVTITNCWFKNLRGPNEITDGAHGGDAIYFSSCTQAYVDDCQFATNGVSFSSTHPGWSRHKAGAVYIGSTPTVFRNCRFAACCAAQRHDTSGGIVCFAGASGGSRVVNCVFVGNGDFESASCSNVGKSGGVIACEMSTQGATLDIENCTIAYNLTQGYMSAAGINVYKGTVNLKNSIIYDNIRGRANAEFAGADIDVKSGATLNIAYTLVTGLTTNYIATVGGTINVGAGVFAADPLFVTPSNTFNSVLATSSSIKYIPSSAYPIVASIDVHLRSKAGYLLDGKRIQYRGVVSPAIDAGDPESDYSKESYIDSVAGHGKRVNLGAYGNTPWASMTPLKGNVLRLR